MTQRQHQINVAKSRLKKHLANGKIEKRTWGEEVEYVGYTKHGIVWFGDERNTLNILWNNPEPNRW